MGVPLISLVASALELGLRSKVATFVDDPELFRIVKMIMKSSNRVSLC